MTSSLTDPASFRDPSGFVFRDAGGVLCRQVNRCYEANYRQLMDSGLYAELVKNGLLIEHEELPVGSELSGDAAFVLRPEELRFISYPYEWPFSALKEAALLTLDIQQRAMKAGMSLKDASAYNVQFRGAQAVFIDTLSFESHRAGEPWSAYGQFCRHFLAPLTLMAKRDISLGRLLSVHLDGIPLDLAVKLLPTTTCWNPRTLMHIVLHAKLTSRYSNTTEPSKKERVRTRKVSKDALSGIVSSLKNAVSSLHYDASGTEWADYYENNSYTSDGLDGKSAEVRRFLERVRPETVWDLGANTGKFSRIAASMGAHTIAFDIDPACIEMNFRACRKDGERNLQPLLLDLANPSPPIGWAHRERKSLADRGPVDVVMALALVHHLAISNNLPFELIADHLSELGHHLIIEFVPKTDPQVKRLLSCREDIFENYNQSSFEAAFGRHFVIEQHSEVGNDGRVLYLMKTKEVSVALNSAA